MLKPSIERYEFSFDEQINSGGREQLNGFVIDVCPEGNPPMTPKKSCMILLSDDKEGAHTPFGYIEFIDTENLALAEMGLELIQQAMNYEIGLKESKQL